MHTSRAPWLANYDRSVPATLAPYPTRTILDYVSDHARTRPHAAALIFKGGTVTWQQLERESDAFAAALRALGVTRGDRVGLLLPNCPQFFVVELAAWKLGAIVAPLNVIYTEHELEEPLRDNAIDTIVTLSRFYDRVNHVRSRTPLKRVIVANIKEYFPPLLKLLFTLVREKKDGDRVVIRDGDYEYGRLLATHRGQSVTRAPLTQDDPAVLLMSGGTTGTPKGVLGRHGAYVLTGLQIEAWTGSVLGKGDSILMLPLPMFHVYANVGVQALALVTGNPIALIPNPRDLKDLLSTINKVKPTFFTGVPTLYVGILNHPDVQSGKIDIKSIKICFSGAAALLAETKARFEQITGGRIVEGYSLTEAMMALCVNPVEGPNKLGSVGMPLPDVTVRIYDGDEGVREMPTGEVGEICFSAPQLMVGFWNRPEETSTVLRDHVDEDGSSRRWLHTGDLGYLDEDGYLFIVDRKKDLIKTSGYQVWPREVEEALARHPAVLEVGVTGVPDPVKGEAVRAYVVLRPGQHATEEELRGFCRADLAPYKVPGKVEFRKDLPKTMVGKILRRGLKDHPAG
ncbi:MAG: long-chain fatty acid--CoA ligase [Acidobacteria bacterium]|nr:long-chain fatty acid--CoA ligase [Acidobacteriota bacterium]